MFLKIGKDNLGKEYLILKAWFSNQLTSGETTETIDKKTSVVFKWGSNDPANEPVVGSQVMHPVSFI